MTRKDLRALIRECYQEKLLENANPFTDVTISETGNLFTDSTIDEIKLDSKFEKEADIDAMDNEAKAVYKNMISALGGVGEGLRVDREKEDLMKVPLIRDVVNKGYMNFTLRKGSWGDSTALGSGDRSDARIDYKKYESEWKNVRDNKMSSSTRAKGDKLLAMLKKYDRQYTRHQENFQLVLVSAESNADFIELFVSIDKPGVLKKIFTLGMARSDVYVSAKRAGGRFSDVDLNNNNNKNPDLLPSIGRAILAVVKDQGGTVSVKGAKPDYEKDDEVIASKAKIGMTVKENRNTRK